MGFGNNTNESIIGKTSATCDTDIYFQTGANSIQESIDDAYANANTVSGMKIMDDIDTTGMGDLLDSINNANKPIIAETAASALEIAKQQEQERELAIRKRQEVLLAQKAEEEDILRKQKQLEEDEELRLLEEEKASKKASSTKEKEDNVLISNIKNVNILKPTLSNPLKGILGEKKEYVAPREKRANPLGGIINNSKQKIKERSKSKEETSVLTSNEVISEKVTEVAPTSPIDIVKPVQVKEQNNIDWKDKATHDELTGLKNRAAYEIAIKDFDLNGSLIFADVNSLKYINDNLGHNAGDILLSSIAKVLNSVFTEDVYRIGGDEFVILTMDNESTINKKIKGIIKDLAKYTKDDKSGTIYSLAIGAAIGDGIKSVNQLTAIADKDMYEKKKAYKDAHPELNIRTAKETSPQKLDDVDWKSLAMIDGKTKLYNKLAMSMHTITQEQTIALLRIPGFSGFKRQEGDRQLELIAQLIKTNISEKDKAFFIDNGAFIIVYDGKKTTLEAIKTKARTLSLGTEMTTITNIDKKIDEIVELLEKKLNSGHQNNEPKSYNDKLSLMQRKMKESVKDNHELVQEEDFGQMLTVIQKKANDIISLFMTSKDFNSLFIFFDVFEFLGSIYELQDSIDFSYIYAVYPGGALYYGADEYSSEISDLFQKIADGLQVGTAISPKDIQKIEGINIFEKIYIQ